MELDALKLYEPKLTSAGSLIPEDRGTTSIAVNGNLPVVFGCDLIGDVGHPAWHGEKKVSLIGPSWTQTGMNSWSPHRQPAEQLRCNSKELITIH